MAEDKYTAREIAKEEEKEKTHETTKKVSKIAAQAVATYYGGQAAGTAVSMINNSGVAEPIYDRVSKITNVASKMAPGGRLAQKVLNKADDEGLVDMAGDAVDKIGSGGAGAAVGKEAGKAAAKETGKSIAKNTANKSGFKAKAGEYLKNRYSVNNGEEKKGIVSDLASKEKDKIKQKAKQKAIQFILRHPWLIVVFLGLIAILLIIFIVVLAGGDEENENNPGYYDDLYNYNDTMVNVVNSYSSVSDQVLIGRYTIEEFVKGAAYYEMNSDLSNLSSSKQKAIYGAYMIVAKSRALSLGSYNNETKEITIQSGAAGIPFCDMDYGCKIIKSNGKTTYVSKLYKDNLNGTVSSEIQPADSKTKSLIEEAYKNIKDIILVPKSVNEPITNYSYSIVAYSPTIKQKWISKVTDSSTYSSLISITPEYSNSKTYNINDYADYYFLSDNSSSNYWWPIGSSSKDGSGLYSGKPTSVSITSKFGYRSDPFTGETKYHSGIDIGASCGTNIIAIKSGTVRSAVSGSSGYGYYIIIDHGDGISSRYAHMTAGSFAVKAGDKVVQGQLIGKVGTTGRSTGCHLHFEIMQNNSTVDPLSYVSASNSRPKEVSGGGAYISGSSNQQTVCLSLKQSGFSNNAVAAIMTNMRAESSFKPTVYGDGGTSYGLCQWHNGRFTKLKNYCGNQYSTIKCQISYLIHELQTGYKKVYSNLRSNNSAYNMADYYCQHFEIPAARATSCPRRASNYANSYLAYVNNNCK